MSALILEEGKRQEVASIADQVGQAAAGAQATELRRCSTGSTAPDGCVPTFERTACSGDRQLDRVNCQPACSLAGRRRNGSSTVGWAWLAYMHRITKLHIYVCMSLQALASFIIIQAALKRSHKLKKFSAR